MKACVRRCLGAVSLAAISPLLLPFLMTGCALFYGSNRTAAPTVAITASPTTILLGASSTLTVNALNATQVTISGSDGSSFTLPANGGTQVVTPKNTTTYTVTATGSHGTATGTATVTLELPPAVTITANPAAINAGNSSTLTVTATGASQVTVAGSDGTTYTLQPTGGTQAVSPKKTTTYTATATGVGGNSTATATITVTPASLSSITHIIFMMQENHSFDNYFGMLNPFRHLNNWNIGDDGVDYEVDGIDDKLSTISNQDDEGTSYSLFKFKSTCIDDESSDWLASYGDVNRYDFTAARQILMDGFVHNAEGYAKNCAMPGAGGTCAGNFTDLTGHSSMGYYDQDFLNYYYFMAAQFAISDRWFSPVSSKSVDNRIATFTGGTTQGIVKDPGGDDHLPQLDIPTIFQELDQAKVSWKIYYSATQGLCAAGQTCSGSPTASYPATDFANLAYSSQYFYGNSSGAACKAPTQPSSVVGDSSNSFCIDPTHITPISTYFTDLTNGTLPSFAFIEAGYGFSDEHPGSGQSILVGQVQVSSVVNALMQSPSWSSSVFFLAYDEGGGPYDHVPPVPGHSNDKSDSVIQNSAPDISSIAVNPDSYNPCVPPGGTPTTHCDLTATDPGAKPNDAAAQQGFAAQLGFRIPNIVISPFIRKHYVSHVPIDHTAVIKFVENRFIGSSVHLTARDASQPDLLDFFDFTNIPWQTPPNPPAAVTSQSLGYDPCTPTNVGP
jgi:phospholipase C